MIFETSFKKGHASCAFKDETGKIYGKLTVIKRVENSPFQTARWLCKCECGNVIVINASTLRNGRAKSCGCLNLMVARSGNIIYNNHLAHIRGFCNKKNLPFNLDIDDIRQLMTGNCYYCNKLPYIKKFAYHRTRKTLGVDSDESILLNGIDQIIPSLGYVKDNVVSCCKYCNRAKSDLSVYDFKLHITDIYNNLYNIKNEKISINTAHSQDR